MINAIHKTFTHPEMSRRLKRSPNTTNSSQIQMTNAKKIRIVSNCREPLPAFDPACAPAHAHHPMGMSERVVPAPE
jgi:hypothetical protein